MIWEDAGEEAGARARALVDAVRGPKDLKRLGKWLDQQGDADLRVGLLALARTRGVELPDDAIDWPGKRLLRRSLAREASSRVRTNPIARDEAFTCMSCGKEVPPHGRTARDHCPWCLRSRHVDELTPGDRAASCGGRMDPVEVLVEGERIVIVHHCTRCRKEGRVRAVLDGEVPDDWAALVALSAGVLA